MRFFKKVAHRFLAAGSLVALTLGLASCGQYSLFKVEILTSAGDINAKPQRTDRDFIATCTLTITEMKLNKKVLTYTWSQDSDLCGNGHTKADVGAFSYSTADVTGQFDFKVEGFDSGAVAVTPQVVQCGHQTGNAKPFNSNSDEVNVAVQTLPGPCP
jgi:hypothetical protein